MERRKCLPLVEWIAYSVVILGVFMSEWHGVEWKARIRSGRGSGGGRSTSFCFGICFLL